MRYGNCQGGIIVSELVRVISISNHGDSFQFDYSSPAMILSQKTTLQGDVANEYVIFTYKYALLFDFSILFSAVSCIG